MSDYCAPEFYTVIAMRLSSALKDAGVTEDIVMARRNAILFQETALTMQNGIQYRKSLVFMFGSQSEGTTTPGLQSDVDMLRCGLQINVIKTLKAWEPGILNVLMFKDEECSPQQYFLQVIKRNYPEPTSRAEHIMSECHKHTVLLSSGTWRKHLEGMAFDFSGTVHTAGPSASWSEKVDMVSALGVWDMLPEVKQWIDRHRPGHWPTENVFEEAKKCLWFLVPVGHPLSERKHLEWRLSPNLIERELMFSLNMTQLRCCVLLKIIKKALFNKVVENGISSFHCKTVLLYTIERTHARLWQDHNLVLLVILCLHTLRRWLKCAICPHYVIEGVNLFDGKLSYIQCRKLHAFVSELIENNLQGLCSISIDNIGRKLLSHTLGFLFYDGGLTCDNLHLKLKSKIEFGRLCFLHDATDRLPYRFEQRSKLNILRGLHMFQCQCVKYYIYCSDIHKEVAEQMHSSLLQLQASIIAAYTIRNRTSINQRIIGYLLRTNTTSSRLKLASILLCSGNLCSAIVLLRDLDRRFNKQQLRSMCLCNRNSRDSSMRTIAICLNERRSVNEQNIALCVHFLRHEAYCVPPALIYEMNRTGIKAGNSERMDVQLEWKKDAIVDARVFLYYLQYLTYGGLGARSHQLCAMRALEDHLTDHKIDVYHRTTALNLLGHCYEMEGKLELATNMYTSSLGIRPENNVANWHLKRVNRQ